MAEIKSTLDLVMEKTRHLRLSREEKAEQKLETFKKKLNGLLLQFEDGVLDMVQFGQEFKTLERQFDMEARKILINEISEQLTVTQLTPRFMYLLKDFCYVETHRLESIISECQFASTAAAEKRAGQIKADLAKNRYITGTAVKPNLDSDRKWHSQLQSIRLEFGQLLDKEKKRLTS